MRVLLCWVGTHDFNAAEADDPGELGPIAAALEALEFDLTVLLNDWPEKRGQAYLAWVSGRTSIPLRMLQVELTTPMAMNEVYEIAKSTAAAVLEEHGGNAELTFHISPGTSIMAASWILLSKVEFPARLISTSRAGVAEVDVPFDIDATFLPALEARRADRGLKELAAGATPRHAAFDSIIHESDVMSAVLQRAEFAARTTVPVLIEGESGTGKELLAKAIHDASARSGEAFIAINCGGLPEHLVESELFGHRRGAFTGAGPDHLGVFRQAHKGTVFLDEIGELQLSVQAKLLRALAVGKVRPVGETTEQAVDVRIIAATHRTLVDEVAAGRFRADLHFRLAVAILKLPALRDRGVDRRLLFDRLLSQVNDRLTEDYDGYTPKKLSPGAKKVLLAHPWPGNIRELLNTLTRAALWAGDDTITKREMEAELFRFGPGSDNMLERSLGGDFDIQKLLDEVKHHYVLRAWEQSGGVQSKAANLLGLEHYQTYSNWLKKAQKQRSLESAPSAHAR
ncbi:MAG: sigma-54 dependent transcriptional regulator [Polyangiaceae bacterium]